MEGLTSTLLPRAVLFYHENNSQFDRNSKAETGPSIDAEIEIEDAPTHVPREKLIRNELAFISFDLNWWKKCETFQISAHMK